ncbi:MAG: hypothetical protein JXA20_01640 [Spirochaetes bacterium]|nr:hypothetical protein [Spirochaetota bacterium]
MPVQVSNKAIFISSRKELSDPVDMALKRHGCEIARGYLNLFSVSIIRKQVERTKELSLIGAELVRFIREQGAPCAIILDGRIDCGLGHASDPDGSNLFKSLLLSCMILGRQKGNDNLRGNFLFLAADPDVERLKDLTVNPRLILASMDSQERDISTVIEDYSRNIYRFGNRFYIECVPADRPAADLLASVDRFLNEIKNRENLARLKTEGAPVDTTSTEPAIIACRTDEGAIILDGEISAQNPGAYEEMVPGELYVIGNWTSKTQLLVSKKIARMVLRGIEEITFEKTSRIIINITGKSKIDASTAASIAGLISKDLKDYSSLVIQTNKENGFILKNSPGFGLIQKQIRLKG